MDGVSEILAGLSIAAGVAAIIGAGALMAVPGFARWLTNKVSTFFDGVSEPGYEEDDDEHYIPCASCGEEYFPSQMNEELLCAGCYDYENEEN